MQKRRDRWLLHDPTVSVDGALPPWLYIYVSPVTTGRCWVQLDFSAPKFLGVCEATSLPLLNLDLSLSSCIAVLPYSCNLKLLEMTVQLGRFLTITR